MTEKSHAKFYRNLVRAGLCAAVVCHVQIASAFVAPDPPPGFGGTPGNWTFSPPPGTNQVNSVIREAGKVNISTSGGVAKLPVSATLKAGAARVAAAAIFAHPAVRTAVGIASWLGAAKLVYDVAEGIWKTHDGYALPEDGLQYATSSTGPWMDSFEDACGSRGGTVKAGPNGGKQCWRMSTPTDTIIHPIFTRADPAPACPIGWYKTPAGCVMERPYKPIVQPDFEDALERTPMPEKVPGELPPGTPLPIEKPVVNPDKDGKPAPYFQPTGNPVPNPNYNPADPNSKPYLQPGIRIVPSPTEDNPWRVDIQPINKPIDTSKPVDPGPDNPDDGSQPKPEDEQSLCEKHPDILACSKPELDTPEGTIPKATRDVTIEFVDGGDGACPADAYSNVGGQSMLIWDWQATCTYTRNYVKPVILVGAMFMALMIVLGGTKE